jgi:hypothetical protein
MFAIVEGERVKLILEAICEDDSVALDNVCPHTVVSIAVIEIRKTPNSNSTEIFLAPKTNEMNYPLTHTTCFKV